MRCNWQPRDEPKEPDVVGLASRFLMRVGIDNGVVSIEKRCNELRREFWPVIRDRKMRGDLPRAA